MLQRIILEQTMIASKAHRDYSCDIFFKTYFKIFSIYPKLDKAADTTVYSVSILTKSIMGKRSA